MCMTFFGRLVRKDVKVEHCVDGLPRGIYIVGKKKNTCRQVECQNDKVKDSDARECVISCRIPYRWEITHSRALSFFLKVSVSLLLLSFIPVARGEMLSVFPGVSCTDMFFPSNCRFVHVR